MPLRFLLALLCLLGCTEAPMHFDPHKYKPPPNAVVIEPTGGPWKNSNRWGNSLKNVAMPLEANQTLAVFEGDDIPGPPRVQSILLSRAASSTVTSNADFRARIDYGIGGLNDFFLMDWTRGVQFSLVANWVRVTAITYAPKANAVYSGGGTVTIGAAIAEGTIEKSEPATFTEGSTNIATLTSLDILTIPQFARSFIVHVSNEGVPGPAPTPSGLIVIFTTSGSQIVRYDSSALLNGGLDTGIILPACIQTVKLENTSANLYRVVPIWRLGL